MIYHPPKTTKIGARDGFATTVVSRKGQQLSGKAVEGDGREKEATEGWMAGAGRKRPIRG